MNTNSYPESQLYYDCMSFIRFVIAGLIEKKGLQPLQQKLKKMGGWPVLEGDDWDPSSFTFKDSVYRFRQNGYSESYFIWFYILADFKNSSYRTIYESKLLYVKP